MLLNNHHLSEPVIAGEVAPQIGVITALPHEFAAVKAILEWPEEIVKGSSNQRQRYIIGEISTRKGHGHLVVLSLLPAMGMNPAAARAAQLYNHFPSIKTIFMVGIAGGVPNSKNPEKHVRLGDVVVSSQYGSIQFDRIKEKSKEVEFHPPPRPPDAHMLESVGILMADTMGLNKPWMPWIAKACTELEVKRPPLSKDILYEITVLPDGNERLLPIRRPRESQRAMGQPRIFIGAIGSSNTLLKDREKRDYLRDKFDVLAIEMEGSGIADAVWMAGPIGYLIIRGICDYCDENKNDLWQKYAAITAASYFRALIQSIPGQRIPTRSMKLNGDIDTNLDIAINHLTSLQEIFDGDVWPDQCDRAVTQLHEIRDCIDRIWLLLGSRQSLSPAMKTLRGRQIVLQTKFHSDIDETRHYVSEFRAQCRTTSAASTDSRKKIQAKLEELIQGVIQFRFD